VLREKTVVLVTNALQYLPQADHVVWMEGGTIRAQVWAAAGAGGGARGRG
jgi:ABC-type transport system involved in cytochrome bd biosynthesis fused ATPase/permease subunit